MRNPEFIYRSAEDEHSYERQHFSIEEAHTHATETLEEYKIKPEIFKGLYGEEVIREDNAEITRLKEKFGHQPSKNYADVLEAVICEHGELSNWFGPDAEVIKTAEFDDIKHGVDMVIEFKEKEKRFSHLALGIDVTFGSNTLKKKLERIKASIDRNGNELTEIKYFHSDRQNVTGRLQKVPQVVIGVERESVEKLGLLWMNRKNKELAEHPVQRVILEEARKQLKIFKTYAATLGKDELVQIYDKDLVIIEELLAEKGNIKLEEFANDKVLKSIDQALGDLFPKKTE